MRACTCVRQAFLHRRAWYTEVSHGEGLTRFRVHCVKLRSLLNFSSTRFEKKGVNHFLGEKNLDLKIITINITFKVERLFFRSSQN